MIEFIIKIYIGANLFFAGYYLADTYKWQDAKFEKITCILWCFGTMLFGCVYILLSFVWVLLLEVFKKQMDIFKFHFGLAFTSLKNGTNLKSIN